MPRSCSLRKVLVLALIAAMVALGATVALAAGGGGAAPVPTIAHRGWTDVQPASTALPAAAAAARCKATGVSLYVSPNPARAGDSVRIFGQVMGLGRRAPATRT